MIPNKNYPGSLPIDDDKENSNNNEIAFEFKLGYHSSFGVKTLYSGETQQDFIFKNESRFFRYQLQKGDQLEIFKKTNNYNRSSLHVYLSYDQEKKESFPGIFQYHGFMVAPAQNIWRNSFENMSRVPEIGSSRLF